MSTSEAIGQLADEIDAVPREVPLHDEFVELQMAQDVRSGDDVTVFFDPDRIEHEQACFWVESTIDLEEVR